MSGESIRTKPSMSAKKIDEVWWVDFRIGAKRFRRAIEARDRYEAREIECSLRKELVAQSENAGANMMFSAFAAMWVRRYVRIRLRRSTQKNYSQVIEQHLIPRLGRLPLRGITRDVIARLTEDVLRGGRTAKTVNNILFVLRRSLNAALEWDFLAAVPKMTYLKVAPPRFDFLTPIESDRLIAHAKPEWKLLFLCALRTGLRAGELIGLRWDDVDLGRGQIAVRRSRVDGVENAPKNNRFRYVPIARDLLAELASERRKTGYVFQTILDEPVTRAAAACQLNGTMKRAGLRPIGLHVLRHTFASQLAMKNVPLLAIQMLLGHSTLEMTRRYAHLAPDFLRDVVEVLPTTGPLVMKSGQKSGQAPLLGHVENASLATEISA